MVVMLNLALKLDKKQKNTNTGMKLTYNSQIIFILSLIFAV